MLPAAIFIMLLTLFIYNFLEHGRIKHPGLAVYQVHCSSCHGDAGEGVRTLVPPLTDRDFIIRHMDSLPCWIKYGMNHPITVHGKLYDQPMYPLPLDDIQTANVINFLNKEYFKIDREVSSAWVRQKWEGCGQ